MNQESIFGLLCNHRIQLKEVQVDNFFKVVFVPFQELDRKYYCFLEFLTVKYVVEQMDFLKVINLW